MTNNGQLFITENVRDEIEAKEAVADTLRDHRYSLETAEPKGQSFGTLNDPIQYPTEGEAILYVRDEDGAAAQVGRAAFTLDHEVMNGMGGARVEAVVENVAVVWKWPTLRLLLPDDALPESDVPERYRSGPLTTE